MAQFPVISVSMKEMNAGSYGWPVKWLCRLSVEKQGVLSICWKVKN